MSISALLRGVEARLKSVLDDPDGRAVGVQLAPGRPPNGCGQLYYAVSWAGGKGEDRNPQSHDVTHAITVTLTARLGYAPKDRRGKVVSDPAGLYDLVDVIAGPGTIHGNWDVIAAANALITAAGATTNGFAEPLVLLDFGPEREEGPDWVGARDEADVYAIDVRFGLARRVQVLY